MTPTRRGLAAVAAAVAAVAPLLLGTAPANAATYSYSGSHAQRQVGMRNSGTLSLYSSVLSCNTTTGCYQNIAAGSVGLGYWNLVGGADGAYSTSLSRSYAAGDVLNTATSGIGYPVANGLDLGAIGYIETNYYPHNPSPAGAILTSSGAVDANMEAAATQLAVWAITDHDLLQPYRDSDKNDAKWLPTVWTRARAIATDAWTNARGFTNSQSATHHLVVTLGSTSVAPGARLGFTVQLYDQSGARVAGSGIDAVINVTGGTLSSPSNGVAVLGRYGGATGTIVAAASGTVAVDATLTGDTYDAAQLLYSTPSSHQYLGFWSSESRRSTSPMVTAAIVPATTPTPTPSPTPNPTPAPTPTAAPPGGGTGGATPPPPAPGQATAAPASTSAAATASATARGAAGSPGPSPSPPGVAIFGAAPFNAPAAAGAQPEALPASVHDSAMVPPIEPIGLLTSIDLGKGLNVWPVLIVVDAAALWWIARIRRRWHNLEDERAR